MPTEGAYRKIGNGRPMIAPTKYKNAQKKHRRIGGVKNIYILGGVNVLNGGVITTIKDVIYMKQISKIFVTFGGPLPLGKARAYEKKDGIDCFYTVYQLKLDSLFSFICRVFHQANLYFHSFTVS